MTCRKNKNIWGKNGEFGKEEEIQGEETGILGEKTEFPAFYGNKTIPAKNANDVTIATPIFKSGKSDHAPLF